MRLSYDFVIVIFIKILIDIMLYITLAYSEKNSTIVFLRRCLAGSMKLSMMTSVEFYTLILV